MKKTCLLLACIALLSSVALPLHAQDGCVNSPENPTAILAVVGSAGAFSFRYVLASKLVATLPSKTPLGLAT